MSLTGGCIYCLTAERLHRSAAGDPPRARRPLRSLSRLSRCRRRWLQARNKSRGRARAHGPGAPGGQEARHHSGTARPGAAPVRRWCSAAAGLGRHELPRAPPGSLACCPVVRGSARQGDAPDELSQNSGSAMQGGGGDAPSWGMGPLGPQSASPDRWPAAGGSEVRFRREDPGGLWGPTATLSAGTRSGIVPLCKCRTRRHRNSAGQRSFRDLENGFRDEGHILLSS